MILLVRRIVPVGFVVMACLLVAMQLMTSMASAQVLLPDDATKPITQDQAELNDELPTSTDRIKRILDSAPAEISGRLLDLTEYVLVVGQPPTLSLFGEENLKRGIVGPAVHDELRAITRPSRLKDAAGADVLGIATATIFSLAPRAVAAISGWFKTDDERPRWAGYTDSFIVGSRTAEAPQSNTLLFHRLKGQRVSLHLKRLERPTARYTIVVDDQLLGIFETDISELTISAHFLQPDPLGNLHTLTVSTDPSSPQEMPFSVDVLVVVHAAEQ